MFALLSVHHTEYHSLGVRAHSLRYPHRSILHTYATSATSATRASSSILHPPTDPFTKQTKSRFLAISALIVRRETPLALYKGLDAILLRIVPKMTIRFASSER